MAQERVKSLIGQLSRMIGDDRIKTTGLPITNYLTEDGAWTAQQKLDAIVYGCNELLTHMIATMERDVVPRMIPEYFNSEELQFDKVSTHYVKYDLPDDYGWDISARYLPDNGTHRFVVDIDDTFRNIDKVLEGLNKETSDDIKGFAEGSSFIIVRWKDSSPVVTDKDQALLRYMRRQKEIIIGSGTDDILLRNNWDEKVVNSARIKLMGYKRKG